MIFISLEKLVLFSFRLKFLSRILCYVKKRLDLKDNINFKIYDVTTWEINNSNIHNGQFSRSKSNLAMKFGQLLEYKTKSIFRKKSCTECGGETTPRSFSQKSKLSISLDQ